MRCGARDDGPRDGDKTLGRVGWSGQTQTPGECDLGLAQLHLTEVGPSKGSAAHGPFDLRPTKQSPKIIKPLRSSGQNRTSYICGTLPQLKRLTFPKVANESAADEERDDVSRDAFSPAPKSSNPMIVGLVSSLRGLSRAATGMGFWFQLCPVHFHATCDIDFQSITHQSGPSSQNGPSRSWPFNDYRIRARDR